MKLLDALEDGLAEKAKFEPWMADLVGGMRSHVPTGEPSADSPLIAAAAAMAYEMSCADEVVTISKGRRTMASRLRRGLVFNTVVIGFLLFGSAAFAVTATRNGYAPAPIRTVVDQVAQWTGFDRVSPMVGPTEAGSTELPTAEPIDSATTKPPGNRGATTGPPDNANDGAVGVGQKPEVLPGGAGSGAVPPENSNAGGNSGSENSNAGGNSQNQNPGSSNAGGNSENSNAGGNSGNGNSNAGENSGNSAGGNSNSGGNSGR